MQLMLSPVKRAGAVTAGLSLCAFAVTGCTVDTGKKTPAPTTAAAADVTLLSADYPSYPSLDAMAGSAQAVIEVRTSSASRSSWLVAKEPSGADVAGSEVPVTSWSATVTSVLAGDATVGSNISIRQPGGSLNGRVYVAEGLKKVKPNTSYLLYVEFVEPGVAEALGGDEGQFERIGTTFVSPRFGTIGIAKAKDSLERAGKRVN